MADYELISPYDVRLNAVSSEVVDLVSTHVGQIIQAMTRIAMGERDEQHPELPSLVGLAAPQIGVFERIIAIDMKAGPEAANFDVDLRFIINPRLTNVSAEEELGREGCYSTGDIGGAAYRAKQVTITGFDQHAEPVSYNLNGYLARIAQHEVDHLNGIRFPDRVREPKHLHAFDFKSKDFQRYREEWMTWSNLYSVDDWLKVKQGENSK